MIRRNQEGIKGCNEQYVGIIRDRDCLQIAVEKVENFRELQETENIEPFDWELPNMILLSRLVIDFGFKKEESASSLQIGF